MPQLSLEDALQLVHLYAERGSPKFERAAMRWLERYIVASSRTTQTYLHLAGVVFRDEAERLEALLLSAELSTETSTRLSRCEPTLDESASLNGAEAVPSD